jgi:hypothetical protein
MQVVERAGKAALMALAFIMMAAAGCVGADEPQQTDSDAAGPAGFGDETGAVSGTILDDQGLPVSGAEVALIKGADQKTTVTDEAGSFSFSNVAPGAYQLFVQKLGFDSVGKNVDVTLGNVAQVEITIIPVAIQEPHPNTQILDGNVQCSVRAYPGAPLTGVVAPGWYTGVAVCSAVPLPALPEDKFLLEWSVNEENAQELLLEMTWESTQSTGRSLGVVVEYDGHINDGTETFGSLSGFSPLIVYAHEGKMQSVYESNGETSCMETKCNLVTRVFAEANTTELDWPTEPPTVPVFGQMHDRLLDVGLVVDQRFTQYLTTFHFQGKPEGFTAVQDA